MAVSTMQNLSNRQKIVMVMAYDLALSLSTFILAYFMRLGTTDIQILLDKDVFPKLIVVGPVQLLCFYFMGHYRGIWRFSSTADLAMIIRGVSLAVPVAFISLYLVQLIEGVPRSIFFIQWFLLIVGVGGGRFAYRLYRDNQAKFSLASGRRHQKAIIVGAGYHGHNLMKDIRNDASSTIEVVAFMDDDLGKQGRYLQGIKIWGAVEKIADLADDLEANLVIVAVPNASRELLQRVVAACGNSHMEVKTVPRMGDLLSGKVQITKLKKVEPQDLLGREQVDLDVQSMSNSIRDKTVLVTGAGGSIGSELCYQILKFRPARMICYDQSEFNLYELDFKLRPVKNDMDVHFVIGDIRDLAKVETLFETQRPDIVFHAAAYKHVPMMELNPDEAIKVNVKGTRIVAGLADRFKVEKFILVSTDKAVNPTNVMGTTKRVAEMICQNLQKSSPSKFVTVRFGNVLGSSGSVIPRFQQQIEEGGPITVTHPDIERFFMSIPEAAQLVIQAGALGNGGEIFVLDMGEPVKIVDLAKQMVTLAGLRLGEDIEMEFTGLRPGEKLYEELLADQETTLPTANPRVRVAKVRDIPEAFQNQLDGLLDEQDSPAVRQVLKDLVPEYDIPKNLR